MQQYLLETAKYPENNDPLDSEVIVQNVSFAVQSLGSWRAQREAEKKREEEHCRYELFKDAKFMQGVQEEVLEES